MSAGSLLLGACVAEEGVIASEEELASARTLDSQVDRIDGRAGSVVNEAPFVELTHTLDRLLSSTVEQVRTLSDQELASFKRDLDSVQCGAAGCPAFTLLEARYGLQRDDQLLARVNDLVSQLVTLGYTDEEISSGVIEIGGMDYEIHSTTYSTNDDMDECTEDCRRTYLIAAGSALTTYVTALAACTLAGPAWPICVASATVAYGIAVASAARAAEACVEDCEERYGESSDWNPETDDSNYCTEDSDCDSGEYCDKGVAFGIGQNECRPRRTNGETCTRNGQCRSRCCKIYWGWPQCRPNDRCD